MGPAPLEEAEEGCPSAPARSRAPPTWGSHIPLRSVWPLISGPTGSTGGLSDGSGAQSSPGPSPRSPSAAGGRFALRAGNSPRSVWAEPGGGALRAGEGAWSQLDTGSRGTRHALSLLLPLSPSVENSTFSLEASTASLVLVRAKRFLSCPSSHSLGDSLYRKSL